MLLGYNIFMSYLGKHNLNQDSSSSSAETSKALLKNALTLIFSIYSSTFYFESDIYLHYLSN